MKIAFLTLGCKLNYAETSTYERAFLKAGLEVVSHKEEADLYLINTCSVTATSDAKSRNLIRKMHRLNPNAKLIVVGCSAELRKSEIAKIEGVWKIFGCLEKAQLVPDCLKDLGIKDTNALASVDKKALIAKPTTAQKASTINQVFGAYSTGERTRSFLKVQDGCDNKCHYCTVPLARGESRNIPICECIKMAHEIAKTGAKEIVITGVNTGDFGKSTNESFLDLLKALNAVEGIERYRISSIEPNLLSEQIIDWIASGTKIQPHFHIPLQTGCDELLQKMGRHYTTEEFKQKIEYLRAKLGQDIFIGIDVMVGLPGETEELFNKTKNFISSIKPAFIHIFPYSQRPGTPAASMPGQVSEQVKKERVDILEQMCLEYHQRFIDSQKGKKLKVLFESKEKGGKMSGYSQNYVKVTTDYNAQQVGQIVEIEL